MADRSRSLPPINPWWSERLQEVLLQHHRPENLPVPHDGDLEDSELAGYAGGAGKGRGASTGGRLFVTPPSNRMSEGRGNGGGKLSEGVMDDVGDNDPPQPKVLHGLWALCHQNPRRRSGQRTNPKETCKEPLKQKWSLSFASRTSSCFRR